MPRERPGSAASAIAWSFSVRRSARSSRRRCSRAAAGPVAGRRRRDLLDGDLGDVEVALERLRERVAAVVVEPADEAMRGEHRQPGILQRDQAHEDVPVLALAADLLARRPAWSRNGGGRRRSAARRRAWPPARRRSPRGSATRHRRCVVPSRVGDLAPRRLRGGRLQRRPGGLGRVGVQREDRGDVRARRARQPQPVLLRPGVRALVRAHPPGAVLLDPHPAEEPAPGQRAPVGPGVVLRVRPDRRLGVAHERALQLPASSRSPRPRSGSGSPSGRSIATMLYGERASSAARCSRRSRHRAAPSRPRAGRRRRCRSAARAAVGCRPWRRRRLAA